MLEFRLTFALFRTLQRLSSLEDRMKGSRLGLKAINKALEKLRQFEYKLSDLNSGFNVSKVSFFVPNVGALCRKCLTG